MKVTTTTKDGKKFTFPPEILAIEKAKEALEFLTPEEKNFILRYTSYSLNLTSSNKTPPDPVESKKSYPKHLQKFLEKYKSWYYFDNPQF